MEPLSPGSDGATLAEPEAGSGIALLLVIVVVLGVVFWFGANVVNAVAGCGGA